MKNFVVLLIAALVTAAGVSAQVKIDLQFEGDQFIANEPLIAKVRIINDSGVTLRLGDDLNWLSFAVETLEGPYVHNTRPPKVIGGFELESSHTATKRVDLAPCFNLTRTGKYNIVATVKVAAFNTSFASPSKTIYIVSGSKYWQKEFGVPANIVPHDAGGLPEVRKYILATATSGKDSRFFVRVTDRAENNIRVVPIGTLVSFSKPEPQIDKWSNLHVLYQLGAKSFLYSVVNPDGLLIAREVHEYSESRPTMAVTPEGRIVVHGGNRRPTADDIPPFDTAQFPDPEPVPQPIATNAPATKQTPSKKPASSVNAKDKKKQ